MAENKIQRPVKDNSSGQNKQGSDANININDQLIVPPEPDCSLPPTNELPHKDESNLIRIRIRVGSCSIIDTVCGKNSLML